jgi:hypothetical protein
MVSWTDARDTHPDALVLDRPVGLLARPYGSAPYPNYETAPPSSGHVGDEVDDRLPPKQRVVGVELDDRRVAIDRRRLSADRVVGFELGDRDLVALWEPGTTSALDGEAIADGLEVGAVGVYLAALDDRELVFELDQELSVVDRETGSTWNVLGRATAGPLIGRQLDPVAHLDTFWFAWSGYHDDTGVVR